MRTAVAHGTMAMYRRGCHCSRCRYARSEYEAQRAAVGCQQVDVTPVREHLHALYARGVTRAAVSAMTGIAQTRLKEIDGTAAQWTGKLQRRVSTHTAEAILAVHQALPSNQKTRIPAEPTRRLITRMREHWTYTEIARRARVSVQCVSRIVRLEPKTIQADTALAIVRVAVSLRYLRAEIDRERYALLRTVNGLPPEDVAEIMGISTRTAWRLEAALAS